MPISYVLRAFSRDVILTSVVVCAGPPGGVIGQGDKGVQTYEISPFRDSDDEDSEEEERRSQKPIPQWARYVQCASIERPPGTESEISSRF